MSELAVLSELAVFVRRLVRLVEGVRVLLVEVELGCRTETHLRSPAVVAGWLRLNQLLPMAFGRGLIAETVVAKAKPEQSSAF